MSRLGDVLVQGGPIKQDYVATPGLSSDMRWVRADELNALRDELIELRRIAASIPGDPRDAAPDYPKHPYDGCGACITWREWEIKQRTTSAAKLTGWAGCNIPGHQGCDPWNCRWAPAEEPVGGTAPAATEQATPNTRPYAEGGADRA